MKKVYKNKVLLLFAAIAIAVYLIRNARKPEDYEGGAGPSPDKPELPKISQEELEAVMKFIRN